MSPSLATAARKRQNGVRLGPDATQCKVLAVGDGVVLVGVHELFLQLGALFDRQWQFRRNRRWFVWVHLAILG